jgi:thioredoxin reductase/ferredoxin
VTWVVPLALGGLAILVMVTFTMLSARKRHRGAIAPAQVVGPRILVHDINDDRCTGCDACVAVCPTNVLDLVANKSRVLRFQDCIQCEACMFACPTEALVMFPEGATPPPLKIPEIDENFQTAVSGQYLIGEVAGKPLVKNAANLGRAVIEHMLSTGLYPGALGGGADTVDVAIIGSGPGGISAALTCIQKGLSYVVLDKEQMIASTIARYPKGKLVMAEPYDSENLSLLPVFDSSKEQLIPIWQELIERVRLQVRLGESVETVTKARDGSFDVRTTVAAYRAQRIVLSIGTRGKPRTLQVPGENLPKVFSLLEDPDDWQGKSVLVVGGGDSAAEAALALADAGAKVTISYRGRGFNRAQPKNKASIERYASEGRIKAKLGSQVLQFDPDSVTLQLVDGTQKRYPNDAAFVLIGADPPVAWLQKVGVNFVERPHQFQFGKSDDIVRRFVARAMECPEDAARAAAQVLGGSTGVEPSRAAAAVSLPMPMGSEQVRGPKKWLRSATSIFSTRAASQVTPMPQRPAAPPPSGQRGKKLDGPMPLSEFAKRQKTSHHHTHTGHGRRDQLTAGERTRILRMLRDEGGRIADEESQVHIGAAPPVPGGVDFDFEDDGAPIAPPPPGRLGQEAEPPGYMTRGRLDVPAKPALVVGLEKARKKRSTGGPTVQRPNNASQPPPQRANNPSQSPPMRANNPSQSPPMRSRPPSPPPPPPPSRSAAPSQLPLSPRAKPGTMPPPPPGSSSRREQPSPRRALPSPFNDAPNAGRSARPPAGSLFEEPTRLGDVDMHLLEQSRKDASAPRPDSEFPPKFLPANTEIAPPSFEDEATRLAGEPGTRLPPEPAPRRAPPPPRGGGGKLTEERTRAVDIRQDGSINDIDWDID